MPWDPNSNSPWGQRPGNTNRPKAPKSDVDLDELLKKVHDRFKKFTGGGGVGSPKGIMLIVLVLAVVWLLSGFYRVQPDEQGVVLRFGEWVDTTDAGLNYHLPFPIERVLTPKVTLDRKINIGAVDMDITSRSRSRVSLNDEGIMLTGDENIVDAPFSVAWNISEAGKYLFNIKNPEETVRTVSESVMREVVGRNKLQDAITENKSPIEQEVKEGIQRLMNEYQTGINIIRVQMGDVTVPPPVVDAFNDVQRAEADKVRRQNEGTAYANDITPRARGEARKVIEAASAYKEQTVNQAKGDAERFNAILTEYRGAETVTRRRLYLEAMEHILANAEKVVVDQDGGAGVLPYLPLPELKKKQGN